MGWKLILEDGPAPVATQSAMLLHARAIHAEGTVCGSFDPDAFTEHVTQARRKPMALVNWHAAKAPGRSAHLFSNISTHANDVARLASERVLRDIRARQELAGVMLFNHGQCTLTNAKTAMLELPINTRQRHCDCLRDSAHLRCSLRHALTDSATASHHDGAIPAAWPPLGRRARQCICRRPNQRFSVSDSFADCRIDVPGSQAWRAINAGLVNSPS